MVMYALRGRQTPQSVSNNINIERVHVSTPKLSSTARRAPAPGKRMREAWTYIKAHPWSSEAAIRIKFEQQTITRLIKYNMVEIRQGAHDRELNALDGWQKAQVQAQALFLQARALLDPTGVAACAVLLRQSSSLRHVACPVCKADIGKPCTSTKLDQPIEVTPHAPRQLLWIGAVIRRYGQLEL